MSTITSNEKQNIINNIPCLQEAYKNKKIREESTCTNKVTKNIEFFNNIHLKEEFKTNLTSIRVNNFNICDCSFHITNQDQDDYGIEILLSIYDKQLEFNTILFDHRYNVLEEPFNSDTRYLVEIFDLTENDDLYQLNNYDKIITTLKKLIPEETAIQAENEIKKLLEENLGSILAELERD